MMDAHSTVRVIWVCASLDRGPRLREVGRPNRSTGRTVPPPRHPKRAPLVLSTSHSAVCMVVLGVLINRQPESQTLGRKRRSRRISRPHRKSMRRKRSLDQDGAHKDCSTAKISKAGDDGHQHHNPQLHGSLGVCIASPRPPAQEEKSLG